MSEDPIGKLGSVWGRDIANLLSIDHQNSQATGTLLDERLPGFGQAAARMRSVHSRVLRSVVELSDVSEDVGSVRQWLSSLHEKEREWILRSARSAKQFERRAGPLRGRMRGKVREAWYQMIAFRTRINLHGYAYSQCLLAMAEVLRFRSNRALGLLRPAMEAAALASLMREEPALSFEWLSVDGHSTAEVGKQFHRRTQARVLNFLKSHGLSDAWNFASATVLHPRPATTTGVWTADALLSGRRNHQVIVDLHDFRAEGDEEDYALASLDVLDTEALIVCATVRSTPALASAHENDVEGLLAMLASVRARSGGAAVFATFR